MLLNNVAPDCWLNMRAVVTGGLSPWLGAPAPFGLQLDRPPETGGAHGYNGEGVGGAKIRTLSLSPLLSRALLPPFLSAWPPSSSSSSSSSTPHMTEEPSQQLGLGILVSKAIMCPPSLSPVCPAAMSTDSQHQLIIASVAVKETHFGSDRLMTCRTCSYWVTNTSSRGSVRVTLALRTHYWADSLTH